jgi:hypothetical protein
MVINPISKKSDHHRSTILSDCWHFVFKEQNSHRLVVQENAHAFSAQEILKDFFVYSPCWARVGFFVLIFHEQEDLVKPPVNTVVENEILIRGTRSLGQYDSPRV